MAQAHPLSNIGSITSFLAIPTHWLQRTHRTHLQLKHMDERGRSCVDHQIQEYAYINNIINPITGPQRSTRGPQNSITQKPTSIFPDNDEAALVR